MPRVALAPLLWVALVLAFCAGCAIASENGKLDIVLIPVKPLVIELASIDFHNDERIARREDTGCTGSRPGAPYVCVSGVWTYFNSTVSSGGILEISSGENDFDGTLYMAPGSVMAIEGIGATVWVEGCARLESSLEVTLTESDVKQLHDNGKSTTYDFMESGCNNISKARSTVAEAPEECRVWSVQLGSRPLLGGRYMATLTYTSSTARCNYWWIILISILLITPAVIFLMWVVYRICCKREKPRRPTVRMSD